MSEQSTANIMTNREFIQLVRAKLDASGHSDIAIERSWIDEDTPGDQWLLNVPVGTELHVPLRPNNGFFNEPASELDFHITYFAQALVNLRRAEKSLLRYAGQVRRAANAEIAISRSEGLDLSVSRIGFKSVYASHLSGSSWKDAAMCVIGTVDVGSLSHYLRPTTTLIYVDYPENVSDELDEVREDQRKRQARLAEMDAAGYDLEVDAITLDILAAHGMSAGEVLRHVWKNQHLNATVQHDGEELRVFVGTTEGEVRGSIDLGYGYWNGECFWFQDPTRRTGHGGRVGKCLGDLVDHPVFKARTISRVERVGAVDSSELIHFDMSEKFLFDADTGRIWRAEVALAA